MPVKRSHVLGAAPDGWEELPSDPEKYLFAVTKHWADGEGDGVGGGVAGDGDGVGGEGDANAVCLCVGNSKYRVRRTVHRLVGRRR